MKELDIKQVQQCCLSIAKEFDRICRVSNIPYFMIGGTMLGAIRHKGFIPWDDDMDFAVPRQYFNKLKQILKEELPEDYSVMTMETQSSMVLDIIKIEDRRTLVEEYLREDESCSYGINIDIFPIDNTSSKNSRMAVLMVKLQKLRFINTESLPFLSKMKAYSIKALLFWLNKLTIPSFILSHFATDSGEFVANFYGAYGNIETMPQYVFKGAKSYVFEDTEFYGMSEANEYLSRVYGNFMQLPPENKRHIHLAKVYIK